MEGSQNQQKINITMTHSIQTDMYFLLNHCHSLKAEKCIWKEPPCVSKLLAPVILDCSYIITINHNFSLKHYSICAHVYL